MKAIRRSIHAALCLAAVASLAYGQMDRTLVITGTVIDEATSQPVAGAMVLLYCGTIGIDSSNLSGLQLDTVFTDTKGSFNDTMTTGPSGYLMYYGVMKNGYQINYGVTGVFGTSVSLGTIRISPIDMSNKDTITVTGTVVDSATGAGISGAFVVAAGAGFDTAGNTVLTGANGSFSKVVVIIKTGNASIFSYFVTKAGYFPKYGTRTAAGKSVDLGTIRLAGSAGVITGPKISPVKRLANGMKVYSLNGKLIYAGPVKSLEKIMHGQSSAYIVERKQDDAVIDKRKVFELK